MMSTSNSIRNNNGGPRKMRRSRDAAASDKSNLAWQQQQSSGFDWYGVQGDSAAALALFQQPAAALFDEEQEDDGVVVVGELSKAAQYNCVVLSYLTQSSNDNKKNDEDEDDYGGKEAQEEDGSLSPGEKLLQDLERMQEAILSHPRTSTGSANNSSNNLVILPRSTHKLKRNQLILAYNRALVLQTMGRLTASAAICVEHLEPFFLTLRRQDSGIPSQHDDQVSTVACRLALLLLECILTLAVGKAGLDFAVQKLSTEEENDTPHRKIPSTDQILEWIENENAALLEKDAPLKFLLQIYKSRVALADLDPSGKVTDGNIRLARKDMKIAMEIFQHKLRPSFGADTVSVVSSANSEELSSIGNINNNNNNRSSEQQQQQPPPPSSVVLQKLNQSALCLKAHLEQLKGNTKKSLILCSEALAAINTNSNNKDSYEALHNNNLAVVYETNNRRHLALHALTKSLRAATNMTNDHNHPSLFHRDGTARPDPTRPILGNAAVCALRARKFVAAYECLAAILDSTSAASSSAQQPHPRGWLRLAEACLGIFADLRQRSSAHKFSLVEVDAEPLGIFIEDGLFLDNVGLTLEELVPILGSPEDLEQVQRNPLLRARTALELALAQQEWLEVDSLLTARLSLSYVCLAFGEPRRALTLAQLVEETVQQLESPSPHQDPASPFATNATSTSNSSSVSPALQRLRRRQAATARMYAAEASCTLGDFHTAMKYLVGDGKNDAFERVASELSGVTLETAATNGKGKRRLAQAQAMVRSSVGSVTAAMGNPAAKQFANSATAMEDAYLANRERSPARRALIYTLLREGNHATALSMLMSLR